MKRGVAGLLVLAVVATFAGCSDGPSSPGVDDAELAALVQRTEDLKALVVAEGRMTGARRLELDRLRHDIEDWQLRTGRSDIAVVASNPDRLAAAVARDDGSSPCSPCPLIKEGGPGKVCFLVEESACSNDIIAKVCAYVCISTTSGAAIKPKVPGSR